MNKRGCYCDYLGEDSKYLESEGIPRGYCGFCQTCKQPGHVRHFPGAAPYTGCWCDFHYRRLAIIHPLGSIGVFVYSGSLGLFLWILWLV